MAPSRPAIGGTPGRVAESRPLFSQPDPPRPAQSALWAPRRFSDLRIIGQFHGTYILLESADAILAVDQHAAHERVVFEELRRQAASGGGAGQRLLIPETVDLTHREADALLPLVERLGRAGLEIEPFGGATVKVTALPVALAGRDPVRLVRDLAEKAVSLGVDTDLGEILEECLHLMACHTAVRANAPLSEPEIRALLAGLDDCENPSHCPHGRPTWIRWELREIEKTFRRVA